MNRISNTERLGVNATEVIVIKELNWSFREQPIQDVGIDALIEEVEEGKPQGRFIAVQIKSGKGNFHISEDKLTHYVSHIHYHYWLNLQIPIILVAHLPETNKTYWQEVSSKTFKKTKNKWKIEIPIKQELQKKSKDKLISIMSSSNDDNTTFRFIKGNLEVDTLDDISEDVLLLKESRTSLKNITDIIENFRITTNNTTIKINSFVTLGLSPKDSQVKTSLKSYGKNVGICSRRLESEIELFSELYSAGFWAYEQLILVQNSISKKSSVVKAALSSIEKLSDGMNYAKKGVAFMREASSTLPEDDSTLKKAKKHFLHIADLIVDELNEAKEMADKVKNKIK